MKIKNIAIIVFFVSIANSSFSGIISVNTFISAYLKHSYPLKQQFEVFQASKGQKLIIQSMNDLNLIGSAGYGRSNKVGPLKKNLDQFQGSIGLEQHYSASGTTVSIEDNFGLGTLSSRKAFGNQLELTVLQPVLRNFFGFLDRIYIKQADLQVESNKILYQESIETNIVEAINLYLDWIGIYQEQKILKSIIRNNQVVFNQTAAQLRAGIVEVSDLEIARSSVINYQKKLIANEDAMEKILLELRDYMTIEAGDLPDNSFLNESIDLVNNTVNPNFIRSIQSINYVVQGAKLGVSAARNQYLPALDLLANYKYNSYNNDDVASLYGSQNSLFIGAQMTMPLFFMNARGLYKENQAEYRNLLLEKDQAIEDIVRNATFLKKSVDLSQEKLQQQEELISSLKRQVRSQRQQYKRGTLDLDNLVRGLNDRANAQLEKNRLKILAHQSYTLYLQLIDKLSDKYKSDIPQEVDLIKD